MLASHCASGICSESHNSSTAPKLEDRDELVLGEGDNVEEGRTLKGGGGG